MLVDGLRNANIFQFIIIKLRLHKCMTLLCLCPCWLMSWAVMSWCCRDNSSVSVIVDPSFHTLLLYKVELKCVFNGAYVMSGCIFILLTSYIQCDLIFLSCQLCFFPPLQQTTLGETKNDNNTLLMTSNLSFSYSFHCLFWTCNIEYVINYYYYNIF